MTRRLPADIRDLLSRSHGVLTVTAAKKAGVETSRLRKLHRAGRLVRVATGAYTDANAFDNAEPWTRHRLRVRGVGMTAPADTYATGWSAAAMFEFRTLGDPPALPRMIRPSLTSRRSFTSTHAHVAVAHVPHDHLLWFPDDAMGIVSPALAAVDLARHTPIPAALVVADDVARRGTGATPNPADDARFDLDDALSSVSSWPGLYRSRFVVAHADPGSESVLETLGRFACLQADLPLPVSNASIQTAGGRWFRPDHLWPWHWVAGEADGAVKYDGKADAAGVVAAEKEREWLLRHEGLELVRYGWDLAYHDRVSLAYRFRFALQANPPRSEPITWWKSLPDGRRVKATLADQPSPGPTGVVLPGGWSSSWP